MIPRLALITKSSVAVFAGRKHLATFEIQETPTPEDIRAVLLGAILAGRIKP